MKRLALFCLSACLAAVSSQAQNPTYDGLSYGTDAAQKLDIYMPTGGTAPYPVMVWIHGGAWLAGGRNDPDAKNLVNMLGPRGVVVASLDYRLSNAAKWPAQGQDVKGAIRWLRANAATYNLDTSRIAAGGSSAGGHLAAFLGTAGGVDTFTVGGTTMAIEGTVGGNAQYSSRVNAVLDMYGPADIYAMAATCPTNNPTKGTLAGGASSPESQLIGANVDTALSLCALASPLTYVTPDDPPFLMLHGTQDNLVVSCQSMELRDSLQKAYEGTNKESKLFLLPTQGHGFSLTVMSDTVDAFLTKYLVSPPVPVSPARLAASGPALRAQGALLFVSAPEALDLTVSDVHGRVLFARRFAASPSGYTVDLRALKSSGASGATGVLVATARSARGERSLRFVAE